MTQIILPHWLVLTYDLLEDRRTIDVVITKFSLCLKMAGIFENLDNNLRDWMKDEMQTRLFEPFNRYEKKEEEKKQFLF